MLDVSKIDVSYGDLQVLWEVSLHVEKGEICAVVGPNGAGKTTLLLTISGLLKAASGSIRFLNDEISKLDPAKIVELGISHVPQGRGLFPFMTVFENLELGAYLSEAAEKKEETLELVYNLFPKLKERRNQLAGTLSGGEQQMLTIGRALMSRPKILMLDEPSTGLAPVLVKDLFHVIKRLNSEKDLTILLIEQKTKQALELATSCFVLDDGRIIIHGDPKEVLSDESVKKAYLGI